MAGESVGPVRALIPAAIACAAVAAAAAWWYHGFKAERTAPRTVAVLPFQELGAEARTSYFADGLHDNLIGHLSRIQDVSVISRFSVMPYREQPASFAQVARELGVTYVVEGSVSRTRDQLRVTVRLSDAVTAAQVWSGEYDRGLADLFAVQADVARQIAAAIDAEITPHESEQLDQVPTRSLPAYELYLQALEVERQQAPDRAAIAEATRQLDEAIRLDPEFALAYALQSRLQMIRYWLVGDYDETQLPVALRNAQTARRLAPERAEPYLALALHSFWGHRDYVKALGYLKAAYSREPGNAYAYYLSGQIERRFGRWNEALESMEAAARLDPRNPRVLQTYAVTLSDARRYAEAGDVLSRLSALAPGSTFVFLSRVRNRIRWTGETADLSRELEALKPGPDPYCLLPAARYHLHFQRREFAEAAAAILDCPGAQIGMFSTVPAPMEQFSAVAYFFAGNVQQAREHARAARRRLQERLDKRPDLPVTRMGLAFMLAILREPDAARAQADRAIEDARQSEDAVVSAEVLDLAAALHAHLGDRDRALDELARALELPNGAYRAIVRTSPYWDALREDPGFRAVMATAAAG